MRTEPRRVPRRALLALGLLLGLTACRSTEDGGLSERPDPPPNGPSTIPPEIGRVRPSNGATNQPPGLNVSVTFKEDMNPASLNQNTFTLWSGGEMAEAQVTYDSAAMTATLDPADPLPGGKSFTAYLQGAKTASGTAVDPFWWTFKIE